MITDCREDPCGECRYCRFNQEPREAELPTDAGARWLLGTCHYCGCSLGDAFDSDDHACPPDSNTERRPTDD